MLLAHPGRQRAPLVNVIEQVVALCASSVVPATLVQQALKEEPAHSPRSRRREASSSANTWFAFCA